MSGIPVDPLYGSSLGQLKAAARGLGFEATTAVLDWDELTVHPGPAVVWVYGNHFVTVDPRESRDQESDHVRVYDPAAHGAATWWSRSKLEDAWSGETLLITPISNGQAPGPHVNWKTCWIDAGVVRDSDRVDFDTSFRNVGNQPLELEIVHASCSCTSPHLTVTELAPGAAGSLLATVNLRGKRGRFCESVIVGTNDPGRQRCRIVFCGTASTADEILSIEQTHVGAAHAGESITTAIFVHDPGEGILEVSGASVVDVMTTPPVPHTPLVTVSVEKLAVTSPDIGTRGRYVARPGDYRLDVCIDVPPDCGACSWQGSLQVQTNLPSVPLATAILRCNVLPDVTASPAAIALSTTRPTTEVEVASHTHRALTVSEITVENGLPIHVQQQQLAADRVSLTLALQDGASENTSGSVQEGHIRFMINDTSEMSVPTVVIVRTR